VEILSTSDVEEREPASVEALAGAPVEARATASEQIGAPELVGETHGGPRSIETVREINPAAPEPVAAAGEIRAEVPGGIPGEATSLATPYLYSLEATTAGQAVSGPPTVPPAAETRQPPPVSESEPVREPPSSHTIPPPEPESPVHQVREKPANPRRGWWQRLIQS
jgi:hypothetical protein